MKFKRIWIARMTVLLLFTTSGLVQAAENTSPVDTTKPTISGVKDKKSVQGIPINLLKGVSAKDDVDGKLTSKISVSKVDFSKAGDQAITYTVKDKAGNKAVVTANLNIVGVEDETKPTIQGYVNLVTDKGKEIELLNGVTAIDNVDGDLTNKITTSKINFNKAGMQTIKYSVVDSAGNKGTTSAKIIILDKKLTKCNVKKYVSVREVEICENASIYSKTKKKLSYRDSLTVIATIKGSDWVKVKSGEKTGYCLSDSLSAKQPPKKNIEDVPGNIVTLSPGEATVPELDCYYTDEQLDLAADLWAEEQGLYVKETCHDKKDGIYFAVSDGYYYLPTHTKAGEIVKWKKGAKWKDSSDDSIEHGDNPPVPDTSDAGEGW
jgi:hypothetical protein